MTPPSTEVLDYFSFLVQHAPRLRRSQRAGNRLSIFGLIARK